MELRKVLALRGPNYWANFPVLEAWVDLGELKDASSDELPGFNERLTSWLPTMTASKLERTSAPICRFSTAATYRRVAGAGSPPRRRR